MPWPEIDKQTIFKEEKIVDNGKKMSDNNNNSNNKGDSKTKE